MRRIGVLGGTFDPIHLGHILLGKQMLTQAQLDLVLFVPMARPSHRKPEADITHRLAMCRLALMNEKGMALSESGIQGSVRYTADTLPYLRKEYPGARFSLILGADKLPSLPYWHEADRLFAACDVLCCPRPGISTDEALAKAREAGIRVTLVQGEPLPYSSTLIRDMTAQYLDAPGLPPDVLCYMAENGLYQPDFLPRLRHMMNPRRFRHTLGVRKEAVRLSSLHGLPIQKAALAGLLHDCAKGMPVPVMAKIAEENGLMADTSLLSSGAMMHGPVGAYLAKEQFGVRDEEVLDAIRSHTVGRPGMTPLEMCIFVADATEENREDYDGLKEIRALSEYSLAAAAARSLQLTEEYLEKSGRPFYSVSRQTLDWLLQSLTPAESARLRSIRRSR